MANFDGIFPNATFTRASTAYLNDGTSVTSGVPRYVDGKFGGKGIWVEEGTTNLFTNGGWMNGTLSGWTNYGSGGANGTRAVEVDPLFGYRLNINRTMQTSSSDRWGVAQSKTWASSPGAKLTVSFYVKIISASAGARLQLYTDWTNGTIYYYGGGVYVDLMAKTVHDTGSVGNKSIVDVGDGWYRVTYTHLQSDVVNGNLLFWIDGANAQIYLAWSQNEAKPYATSFTVGTRSAETLTIPTTGLSSTQGTFEAWVYVNSMVKRLGYNRIFNISRGDGNTGISLLHHATNPQWYVETLNDAGVGTYTFVNDSFTSDGWHLFSVTWTTTSVKLYIDGVLRGTISTPNMPSSLGTNCAIGHHVSSTTNYLNTYFDEIRVSTTARTDAEILASYNATSKLTPDNYTQALLHFDNSLLSHEEVKAVLMPNGNLHIRGTKQIG